MLLKGGQICCMWNSKTVLGFQWTLKCYHFLLCSDLHNMSMIFFFSMCLLLKWSPSHCDSEPPSCEGTESGCPLQNTSLCQPAQPASPLSAWHHHLLVCTELCPTPKPPSTVQPGWVPWNSNMTHRWLFKTPSPSGLSPSILTQLTNPVMIWPSYTF